MLGFGAVSGLFRKEVGESNQLVGPCVGSFCCFQNTRRRLECGVWKPRPALSCFDSIVYLADEASRVGPGVVPRLAGREINAAQVIAKGKEMGVAERWQTSGRILAAARLEMDCRGHCLEGHPGRWDCLILRKGQCRGRFLGIALRVRPGTVYKEEHWGRGEVLNWSREKGAQRLCVPDWALLQREETGKRS